METITKIYRSENAPGFIMREAKLSDDEQLVDMIAVAMPSNGMVVSFERSPSYFKATNTLYSNPEIKVLATEDDPDQIVGMVNFGWKDCFINGEPSTIRYVADLRLKASVRRKNSLSLIIEYIYNYIPRNSFYQSIVLTDNHIARRIMQQPKEFFPVPYIYNDITTYTISKVKKPALSQNFKIQILDDSSVERANEFIKKIKDYFNFLPTYDFNDLKAGNHPYWLGMQLNDFSLVLNDQNEIVGLFGLWNQHSFKQTRVEKYSTSLKLVRPLYNAWAGLTDQIRLPKEKDIFDYLMLHSALCKPNDVEVFAYILHQAHLQTKQRNKNTFCTTLADDDPRVAALKGIQAHTMRAKHGLHSYDLDPYQFFDQEKVSYFEVGRI